MAVMDSGLSGGRVAGPDNLPPAANLTPTGLGSWTEKDFVRALREGRRPDGSAINEFMPWRSYASMSDLDLQALWRQPPHRAPEGLGRKGKTCLASRSSSSVPRPSRKGRSSRPGSSGRRASTGTSDIEMVDLAEVSLPMMDEPRAPAAPADITTITRRPGARISKA